MDDRVEAQMGDAAEHMADPPQSEAFRSWRRLVAPMFAVDAPSPADRADFSFSTERYEFATLGVSRSRSSACVFVRDAERIAANFFYAYLFQVYEEGRYLLETDGQRVEVTTGDWVALDMTRPMRFTTTEYANLAFVVHHAALAGSGLDRPDLHGLVLPAGSPMARLVHAQADALHRVAATLDGPEQATGSAIAVATLASCFQPVHATRVVAPREGATATIRRVLRIVDARLAEPDLDPAQIAEAAGLSRSQLYRLFKTAGGVSRMLRRRRLERSLRLLTVPGGAPSVGSVARRTGFSGSAVFARAFRDEYGVTPSKVRLLAGVGGPLPDTPDEALPRTDIRDWLLGHWS